MKKNLKNQKSANRLITVLFTLVLMSAGIKSYAAVADTWNGNTSTDWNDATNWASGIPLSSTNVDIPSAPANQPVIGSANGVCNNITIESGGTLTITSSNTLTVSGNWVNNGTFTANSSTVTFNGTTTISGSSTNTFNNITINGGHSLTGPSSANMNVGANWSNSGTFNHNNGTVTFCNGTTNTIISGSSTNSFNNVGILLGTLTGPSGNMNVKGNWSDNFGIYTNNSGTVTFNGNAAQSISEGSAFYNLSLTGSNTVTFGNATTISNNLSLNSGAVANLGTHSSSANSLTLGGSGTINGSWGGTGSGATNINTTYFASNTGILNVATCTAPPTPGAITGNISVCSGITQTYSIAAVTGATSYTWTLPGGWTGTSTTTSITTTIGTNAGTVSVTANNICSSSFAQTLSITNPPAVSVTASLTSICSGNNVTLSASGGSGSGYALTFNGTNQKVLISTLDISPATIPTLTASAWVNRSGTTSNYQDVFSNDDGGFDRALTVYIDGNYHIFAGRDINTGIASVLNTWDFMTVYWSSSAVTMYKNGAQVFTTSGESSSSGTHGTAIGDSPNSSLFFKGTIDQVSFWNTSRTSAQLQTEMNTVLAGNESGLVAYYKFEEGSGTTTADATSNARTGTLQNAPTWVAGTEPNGFSSYLWSPGNQTTQAITDAPTTTTTYSVLVTNAIGCSVTSAGTVVTVTGLPATPGSISGNSTVCSGGTQTYTIAAVSCATSYTWTFPGDWTGTSTTTSITTTVGADAGTISVTASNSNGTSSPQTLSITLTPPTIVVTASSTSICNGNNVTLSASGVSGYALTFNGSNQRVSISSLDISPSTIPTLTGSAWVNRSGATGNFEDVFSNDDGGYDRALTVFADGNYHIFAGRDINTGIASVLNTWDFMSVYWSSSAVTMYKNGVQVFTTSGESSSSGTHDTGVGSTPSGGLYFKGTIDQVSFWNTSRTSGQLQTEMNTVLAGNESGLVAYYKFDEGSGTTTADATSNARTGTLQNAPTWVAATEPIVFSSYLWSPGNQTTSVITDAPSTNTTYSVYVTNISGCFATSAGTTITVNTSPTISCPSTQTTNTLSNSCANIVNYSTTEVVTGSPTPAITYTFNGATIGSGSGDGSGSSFNQGTTIVTLTATNTCGNPNCSFNVVVTDQTPPVITCPGNITMSANNAGCTAITTLTAPTVSDNCGFGNAVNFDGTNDYMISPYSGAGLTQVTVEFWFKKGNTNTSGVFQWASGLSTGFPWILIQDAGTDLQLYVNGGYNITSSTLTTGTWYHCAVTYNGTTWTMYINGVSVGTPYSGSIGGNARTNIYFGNGYPTYWNGSISEARIWNVARTGAEIQANMTHQISPQSNLTVLYHLNQGTSNGNNTGLTTVIDASGNTQNATLTNMALTGNTSNWVNGQYPIITNNALSTYPLGNTTVTWTATDASNNTATCSQIVTVTNPVSAIITGTTTGCNPVTLTATGGGTYAWSGGNSTATAVNSFTNSGSYSVTVSNSNSCSSSNSTNVTVNNAPATPGAITGNTTVCSGSIQTYTIAAVSGATSYTWTLPTGWTGTSTTTSITATTGSSSSAISVTASNVCGTSSASTTGTITVNSSPSPIISGGSAICGSGTLDAGSYSSYLWGNSSTNETLNVNTSNTYYVTVTDGNGCTGTASQVVTINPNPTPSINGGPSFCVNGTLDAGSYSSYLWGNSSTNETLNVNASNTYHVTVTDGNGCTGIASQAVTINPNPTPSINGGPSFCVNGTLDAGSYSSYLWGNSSTNETLNVNASNTYHVTVTDGNGCTGIASQAVIINPNPTPSINGGPSFCASGTLDAGSYSSYIWDDSSTNETISVSSSGTYSITVTDGNACTGIASQVITVYNFLQQPGSISGNTILCSGSTQTYTIAAVSGTTSYTWTLPVGWTGTSTTNSITTTIGSSGGSINVTANNFCGASSAAELSVSVNSVIPSQPGVITGSINLCNNSVQTYSISSVTDAADYIWTLPIGWTGSSTTTSITVTTGNASGNIIVKASNGCGNSAQRILNVSIIANPGRPGLITGNTAICSGTTQAYSIASVNGATSYAWTLPSGWSGTSTTTSITVTSGTSSGIISVVANNACGTSLSRALTVNITANPNTPGPISGSNSVCSGATQTYSITAVSGATSYVWTLPSGWSGSSTSTSITVTIGNTGGNVSVLSVNNCGISNTTRTSAVSVSVTPSQPGTITGTTSVCLGSSQNYHINAVSGATSYTWTLPSGWSGTSTTTSITTIVGASNGNISVTANNSCGTSIASTLAVAVNASVPSQPGSISGSTSVCQGSSQTYSVSPVAGATSYTWTKPSGWTGTSTTNSIMVTVNATGGTISVAGVNSCGNSLAQTISVISNALTYVTITGNPQNYNFCAQVAPTSVILTASSGYSSYVWSPSGGSAQTATVSSVNTYMVTATNAAGCTTTTSKSVIDNCALPTSLNTTNILGTSAKVTWIESQCRYNYTIQISIHGLNSWTQHVITPTNNYIFTGLSFSTTYDWQIQTNCNTSGTINSGWSSIQTFTTLSSRMAEDGNTNTLFNVYPNPANSMVTITFSTMEEGAYNIKLIDMTGRIIKSDVDNASAGENTYVMNLDGIAKGVYMAVMQKGDEISKSKLIVE